MLDLLCGVSGANSKTQANLILEKNKKGGGSVERAQTDISCLCAHTWKFLADGKLNF